MRLGGAEDAVRLGGAFAELAASDASEPDGELALKRAQARTRLSPPLQPRPPRSRIASVGNQSVMPPLQVERPVDGAFATAVAAEAARSAGVELQAREPMFAPTAHTRALVCPPTH